MGSEENIGRVTAADAMALDLRLRLLSPCAFFGELLSAPAWSFKSKYLHVNHSLDLPKLYKHSLSNGRNTPNKKKTLQSGVYWVSDQSNAHLPSWTELRDCTNALPCRQIVTPLSVNPQT